MDSLNKADLREDLKIMQAVVAQSGWNMMVEAAKITLERCGRLDDASVSVAAKGLSTAKIAYDEPIDLNIYDAAMSFKREDLL
ncbi:MAG: hypothetical protein DBY20_01495 [Coriobacteriia bacterium]|nr:MAG: hypothetical protein DBY20_01180 [Coriobacteriia bacterium]PWL79924.1 MAG: hypothetical protein DBY20_01495 [Coriobacteriia bacterium]